jgi:hypothetical protein
MPMKITIRKIWTIKPFSKAHSTPKGKKGYIRSANRKIERNWSEN